MEPNGNPESSATPSRRKWLRRGLIGVAVSIVAIAVIVGFLPTILSGSIGRSLITGAVQPMVQGEVSISDLSLSWSGPQVIRGFAVKGKDGASIRVDVTANNGLIGLARGSEAPHLTILGSIATVYRPDGTFSLTELFQVPVDASATSPVVAKPQSTSGSLAETLRGLVVEITSLQFVATSSQSGPRIEVTDFKGKVAVENLAIRASFASGTKVGEKVGSLALDGRIDGLFAADGSVDVAVASVDLDFRASALAIPAVGIPLEVESISLKVSSTKIADAVRVMANTVIQLPTGESAQATIDLSAANPLDAAKRSVAGSISVVNLPTSALAPYLPAPLDAARDLGPNLNATITLDGRKGGAEIFAQKFAFNASGVLSESGDLATIDRLSISAQVDPALVPPSLKISAPVAVTIEGNAITLPVLFGGAAVLPWKDARVNANISVAPMSLSVSSTVSLAIGATTIAVQTSDPMSAVNIRVQSSIDGSALVVDQVISGLVDAGGLAIDSARARGSVQIAPVVLATLPWLDAQTRNLLAECAVTTIAANVSNDGTVEAGTATLKLVLSATEVKTDIAWTKSGFSTKPIDCALTVAPSLVAHFAGPAVALDSPARIALQVGAIEGSWTANSAGRVLPATINAKISADRIDLAMAPGLVRGGSLRGVVASATITTNSDSSIGGLDAQLQSKILTVALNGSREAASIVTTIRLPDLGSANFQSTIDLAIASGDTLATMLDIGEGSATLVGPGSIKGSFNRSGSSNSFTADVALPRLTLKTSGSLDPATGHIDVAKSTATFNVPTEIVEQALGLRSGVDWKELIGRTGGRTIGGSLVVESLKWTGKADDASVVMNLALEPGSIEPPNRAALSFGKVALSVKSPRLAERAQAALSGEFTVGAAGSGTLSVVLDANGDLRSLLGAGDYPLSLKSSTLAVKVPGALAIAISSWSRGSDSLSKSITNLGDINAAFTINSLALPIGATTTGSADLRLDLAAIAVEPTGKPKLALGKTAFTVKSVAFDRELIVGIDGTFQAGDSAPGPVSLAVAASGDLRSFFGATKVPLTLQASELQVKLPGALALALADWASGNKDASSAVTRLGSIDAGIHLKSLNLPANGLTNASFDVSVDLAPIEVEPKGKPIVGLAATNFTARSPRLADSLTISMSGSGVKSGSFTAQASGSGLADPSGAFDPSAGAWTAQLRASKIATAIIDAACGQGGQLVEALGPELDATVDAKVATDASGLPTTIVDATVKSQYLSIAAANVQIGNGVVLISSTNPLSVTFTINKVLQRRLLEPLNPILADIRSAPPIQLHVSRASYPLDGNLCTLDLDARVDVGDVEVVRSNQVLGVLALAQSAKSDTIPARIEPLIITVRKGILRYSDFRVEAGKFGDQWQQKLKLSGDIDLCKTPPYAIAITCRYPLSSLGRTIGGASSGLSSTMQQLSDAISKLPVDPGDLMQVDITLSGPLGEVQGKSVPLASKVKLVFDASSLDGKKIQDGIKNIGGTLKDIGKLFGK